MPNHLDGMSESKSEREADAPSMAQCVRGKMML